MFYSDDEGETMHELVDKIQDIIDLSEYKLLYCDSSEQKAPEINTHENTIVLIQRENHITCVVFNYDQEEVCFFDPMGSIKRYEKD